MTAITALALAILFAIPAAAQAKESTETVAPPQVEEIKPGILAGYLDETEHPDNLALLPPHPKPGTAAYRSDEAAVQATFPHRGSARWQQAIKDANLQFPEAAEAFDTALGFKVTETDTPYLFQLMRRTLADAGLSTYGAKNVYKRERPFMSNGRPIGTPEEEAGLRKDGSYPSGHTAIGWAWALILCEVVPERTDDTGDTREEGEHLREAISKISDKPVKVIIYSHSHYAFGARALVDDPDEVLVIGHPKLNETVESSLQGGGAPTAIPEVGPIMTSRLMVQFNNFLPTEGPDAAFATKHEVGKPT